MKLTVNTNHLALIDRVVETGILGKSRGDVLKGAVIEHVRFLLAGGTPFRTGPPGFVEVDTPTYGAVRDELIIQPITGKAIPVRTGEVLRISQVEGGTCVDYNAYNLHDYKEWLDCGFNRTRGVTVGKGTIIWTGSPRARPMQVILDHSDNFDQYYQGHRCNGLLNEIEYGFIDHPNCQDTFAEAIREYGLTPDDVHDSYNLWMRTTVTPDGRREFHWNRARQNDYVDLLAVIDTLSVPIICGIDTIPLNNYDPGSIRLQVFAASPSTRELVEIIQKRFGRFRAQKTPQDFKKKEIRTQRELEPNPNYVPNYWPTQEPIRSFGELGAALGRDCANVTPLEENPALDTEAATRAKVEKAPFSAQKVGREALKLWIPPLADSLAKSTPPRGFEQVLHGLDHKQLAFLSLRSIANRIHFGWDKHKDRRRGRRKNPDMLFRLELGRAVRDELEFDCTSHKRSEVVVVTLYGCTRVCSSSVNADLRASYQAKAPNATDTTAAIANNIHIAGFPPKRNIQLSTEWQRCEGRRKKALAALWSTVRAGAAFDIDSLFVPIYLASDSTAHLPAPIMIVAVPSFMVVPANVKFLLSRSNS